jgi:SAM-dependent methyltransferase
LDAIPQLGVFDYVIGHGVYSWVPAEVQQKILQVCKTNLAPQGIAYVSYNTYPGWHMRGMIRDILQFHVQQFTLPAMKVRQARNLLDFLGKAVSPRGEGTGARGEKDQVNAYAILLRNELESFRRSSDSYLFHEHLEEVNEPIYFHQFIDKAAEHGLRYLGEADLRVMVPGNFPPEIENVLQMVAQDAVHLEQYMDFLRNRMFRQTLLCHKEQAPNYGLRWETVRRFAVASPAKVVGTLRVPSASAAGATASGAVDGTRSVPTTEDPMVFETPDGITLQARDAIVQAAMMELGDAWPKAIPFNQLLEQASERMRTTGGDSATPLAVSAEVLGRTLLQSYVQASTSLVEFWLAQPSFTTVASERPAASPLARRQAEMNNRVTTLRHETAHLGDFERHLLRLLDGTRDRIALREALIDLVQQGELTVEKDGQPVRETGQLEEIVGQALTDQLQALARHGLLLS